MDEKIIRYLFDIHEAINHIQEFTININSFFDYENNLLVRRAVERELEIIGEAMNRILNLDNSIEIEIEQSRRIVDLRNRVIHGYDKVDNGVIWGILKRHIPKLGEEIKKLLTIR